MAERIANARKEAEYLKDKIREKKAALNDTSRKNPLTYTLRTHYSRVCAQTFFFLFSVLSHHAQGSKGPHFLEHDPSHSTNIPIAPPHPTSTIARTIPSLIANDAYPIA
jgi:hypothetical protein